MSKQVVDPWLLDASGNPDPFAGTIDFSMRPEDEINPDGPPLDQIPNLDPQIIRTPVPAQVDDVVPTQVEVVPDPDEPEVIELEDGGRITLEKTSKGWKATLDPGNGANPEVFFGKNKNELVGNVLKAKLNATKKIRDLNRQIKLGGTAAPRPEPVVQPQSKELDANEIFELKTMLDSNPDLAFDTWFQKKTGLSVQQLVGLAKQGSNASLELQAESVNRDFTSRNPDYFPDSEFKNFASLVKWVSKFKMGKTATDANASQVFNELVASGFWTVENIEEAFEDLKSDQLIIFAPKASVQVQPVVEQPPAPRPDSRIVNTTTRPRAALGIRPNDITPVAPVEAPKAPSDDDFNNMSDTEVATLMAQVRRAKLMSRRSQ